MAISDFGASTSRFDNQPGATVRLASVEGGQTVDDAGFYVPTTGTGGRALPNDVYSLSRNGVVQSQLLNLGEFNHAGTLDLRGPAIGNTLLVSSASSAASAGTGVFVSNGGTLQLQSGVRSVASAHESDRYADMLIVDATRVGAGGATQILVDYDPSDMGHLTVGNGVELVEVRDAAASAPGAFALGNRVAGGAYEYALHHGGIGGDAGDGNWYLRSYVRTDTVDSGTPREPAPELPNYRKEVPVAMVVPALAHQLGLSTLGTYHDRGGEDYALTTSGNATHGYGRADRNERRAWGRIFGSTGKVRDGSGSAPSRFDSFREHGPRYDVDLGGMQLGLDVYRHLDDDGSRDMAGAYFAASHAKADVEAVLGGHAGKVSMNGYSLGAYWTHMGRSRWYLDAVAQLTKYDGVSVRPVDAEKISPDGWGMAASIEAGKPFRLNQNWTFEPQAQLIYQHISWSGSERDRFGKFRFSDSDAVYSRLGARVVRNWEQSDGREYAIWARANVWHNFSAKANTTFTSLNGQNAVTLGTNLGGTWGQFGLGFNAQLKDNLNAFIAVDYERSLGSRRSHGASGRVGVQYVW